MTLKKYGFSVIIPTYNTPEFLLECLDKFKIFDNIEVIVGVDGCKKTEEILLNYKRPNNYRFFYFTENSGPYCVKNNLIKESKSDVILFFDSDDIPYDNIFEQYNENFDIVRLFFQNYGGRENSELAWGVFFIKKILINKLKGFQEWVCHADVEFINRSEYYGFKIKTDKIICFRRRIHEKNITITEETNEKSTIRQHYQQIIRHKKRTGSFDHPQITLKNYYEF